MLGRGQSIRGGQSTWPALGDQRMAAVWRTVALAALRPLASPIPAGLIALVFYLVRAAFSPSGYGRTSTAYFNFLADAFLHGQLALRVASENVADLIVYNGQYYLYWPPFPAILLMPLVALFGADVSDILYTAILTALSIALVAKLLQLLDRQHIAPLTVERRAILVTTMAFGSVLLILAPAGRVWHTAQIVGWVCVLLATVAALTKTGPWGYFLVGLALACATMSRTAILFNGVWLAYFMLRRDRAEPLRRTLALVSCGLAPVTAALLAQGWYNLVRFGSPLDMGLAWHKVSPFFANDFARYGTFSLHYLPTNLYYEFVAYTVMTPQQWMGGGLFWMTPVLLGAPAALWFQRRLPLVWALLLSCLLSYIPVGLCMGTGYITFGPRYLLDLMVPILVLTAIGIRRWQIGILILLMLISCATYLLGSVLWALFVF